MADSEKTPLLRHAELALKIGTAVLGTFYVFGLMISNAQLMELGITDFASLQSRNVMVGLLFVVYLLVLAAVMVPVALILPLCLTSHGGSFWRCLRIIALLVFFEIALLTTAGSFVGYLYPWGLTWTSYVAFSPRAIYQSSAIAISQLYDTYYRAKILVVVLNLLVIETAIFFFLVSKERHAKKISETITFTRTYPVVVAGAIFYIVTYTMFALFDYANEAYPNFRYNLGGGQPQVANLTLAGKPSEMSGLDEIGLSLRRICCFEPGDETNAIADIAIWYQSDKFLYIANAAHSTKSRVVAIDLKLVRSIHYLPKHVMVVSGARIEGIRLE